MERSLFPVSGHCHSVGLLYTAGMTAIALELDRQLKRLSPERAASVAKVVRDVLDLVEAEAGPVAENEEATQEAAIAAHREHIRKALDAASELDWSDFERPPQGEYEKREEW